MSVFYGKQFSRQAMCLIMYSSSCVPLYVNGHNQIMPTIFTNDQFAYKQCQFHKCQFSGLFIFIIYMSFWCLFSFLVLHTFLVFFVGARCFHYFFLVIMHTDLINRRTRIKINQRCCGYRYCRQAFNMN